MKIQFNKVTWYSKLGAVILFLVVIPVIVFYISRQYQEVVALNNTYSFKETIGINKTSMQSSAFSDPLNGTYKVDGQDVTFVNGKSEREIFTGNASKTMTSIFGQPVVGDLNNDGQTDQIFFVSQETGGTGIFFYVVAAVNKGGKYVGTSAVFLGDRIAPQNINIQDGIAAVNYATRREDESMTVSASVGVTRSFVIDNSQLMEFNDPFNALPKSSDDKYSNIVGYFAGGSFYWYVPGWIEQNWNISKSNANGGFTISPKVSIPDRTFSDIVIAVNPSTETYNANVLYEQDRNSKEGRLIINEVLLNKHGQGTITVNMETNTRIYHVQREIGNKIYDRYYLDGSGGKTAYVVFYATTEDFSKYELKIREFVEGIGTGTPPQG